MTFKDITFLVFVKLDNEERRVNLSTMVEFYRSAGDAKFVIVEEDSSQKVPDLINLRDDDIYVFCPKSSGEWNKCKGYNIGIKLATTNILVFNDVDAIIHPNQILSTANELHSNDNGGMMYPYNGQFLCTNKDIKHEFAKSLSYDDLHKYYPSIIQVNYDDGNILVGHTNSRGGCVMGRRDNLLKCNGYNPNFIGWGYEDDEMPFRVHKLGYDVTRLNGDNQPCWHLHHFDGTGSAKETQPNYEHNRQVAGIVDNSNKEQLQEYIKTWEI